MSETDLISQARQGDGAAWTNLVASYQEPVFRLAYLLLGDGDEAQDVAQETFIRAFRFLPRFDPARPLRPWLLRITTNLAYNRRRSAGRYLAALQRLFQAAPPPGNSAEPPAGDPTFDRAGRRENEALWQAIRRLNPADQQIIYLRYFLELSVAETAEAASIAPGTVKSRLSRALERLRRVVAQEFPQLREERTV